MFRSLKVKIGIALDIQFFVCDYFQHSFVLRKCESQVVQYSKQVLKLLKGIMKNMIKKAWPVEKALKLIDDESGKHFDPDVVKAFKSALPHILEVYDKHKYV